MLEYEVTILDSDGDLPIGGYIAASINSNRELQIKYQISDYEKDKSKTIVAVVDEDNTVAMAKYLGVRTTELPQEIKNEFGGPSGICVPSEVEKTFKEVLDFILDCGVKYKFKNEKCF